MPHESVFGACRGLNWGKAKVVPSREGGVRRLRTDLLFKSEIPDFYSEALYTYLSNRNQR